MHRPIIVAMAVAALAIGPAAAAQAQNGRGPSLGAPPQEARRFDFLIGDWELVVRPAAQGIAQKIHGVPRLVGTWKAARALDGWGVSDELRITDASGNTQGLTQNLRVYDSNGRRWLTTLADPMRGVVTSGTAEWRDNGMRTSSRGTDATGAAYLSRAQYTDIGANSFRFVQERSTDGGATWIRTLEINARRATAAPPRR